MLTTVTLIILYVLRIYYRNIPEIHEERIILKEVASKCRGLTSKNSRGHKKCGTCVIVGTTVVFFRLPELLDELSLAKLAADGSYRKLIKKYTKVNVLVLDEWLL